MSEEPQRRKKIRVSAMQMVGKMHKTELHERVGRLFGRCPDYERFMLHVLGSENTDVSALYDELRLEIAFKQQRPLLEVGPPEIYRMFRFRVFGLTEKE